MNQSLNLKSNILGGLTAAVFALPLELAFGVASGLGATAGIYGAIILGFVASLLIVYQITQQTQITLDKESKNTDYKFDDKTIVLKIDGAFFFGSSIAF